MRTSLLLIAFLLAGCSSDSDNGALVNPDVGGDDGGSEEVEEVRYSTDVQPIFAASCSGSGCHIGAATNGVSLGSWAAVTSSVGAQYGGPIIIPGNAAGSPLIDKIGSSPRFGSRMPPGQSALSSSRVQTIAEWIDAGAPNN